MTTVTVDDSTRRRLKRIAASFDVTQEEVIKRALDLLESSGQTQKKKKRTAAVEGVLDEASRRIRSADKEWARVSAVIEGTPMDVEIAARAWAREI